MRSRWGLAPLAILVGLALACTAPASAPPASAPATGSAPTAPAAAKPAATSAAAAPAAATAPPERQSLKFGYNAILAGAPTFVAQDRGYFAEEGFDTEFNSFDSGALMVSSVAAGQLDIIPAVPSPSIFNALARDITMKAVAAQSWTLTVLMLRKQLADSGQFKTMQDLKGRKVSFNVEGSPVDYSLRVAFEKSGMSLSDVQVERVSNTDLAAALANGAVDAGVVPEPLPVLIESRGIGERFGDIQALVGRQTGSVVVIGPSMIERGDAVNTRFVLAYLKGLRDYQAAIKDDKVADPAILDILSTWTKIPPDTIAKATTQGSPLGGRIDLDDMNRQQDFWAAVGQVPTKVDLSKFVEYRYLDAAQAQLH
ncbi:MAG TPA: ABC transporter substrate-binding protein [Chloroflexota bacterium]|jgi:NitT/TauT family transport system substrate-binding protein